MNIFSNMHSINLQLTLLYNELNAGIIYKNNNIFIPVYTIDKFFTLIAEHKNDCLSSENIKIFKEIQSKILSALMGIEVGGVTNSLYNGQKVYNATCTEEDIHLYLEIPYGGGRVLDHLYIHSGIGINEPDLIAESKLILEVDNNGIIGSVEVGPRFEVKDYKDLNSAQVYINDGAGTNTFHNADHVFIHIMGSDDYYIAENKKNSKIYKLVNFNPTKNRKQVKLSLENGNLNVVFWS